MNQFRQQWIDPQINLARVMMASRVLTLVRIPEAGLGFLGPRAIWVAWKKKDY
jgi:hypothetical protein